MDPDQSASRVGRRPHRTDARPGSSNRRISAEIPIYPPGSARVDIRRSPSHRPAHGHDETSPWRHHRAAARRACGILAGHEHRRQKRPAGRDRPPRKTGQGTPRRAGQARAWSGKCSSSAASSPRPPATSAAADIAAIEPRWKPKPQNACAAEERSQGPSATKRSPRTRKDCSTSADSRKATPNSAAPA